MKDTEITINEALALVGCLNGAEAVRAVLQGRELKPLEHGDIALGQVIAAVSRLGGEESFLRLLSAHKLKIVWREEPGEEPAPLMSAVITELPAPLFDSHGRRIPPKGLLAKVCVPNRGFHIEQPTTIDYAARYRRFEDTGLTAFLSVEEFEGRAEQLLEQLREDKLLASVLNGVYLPIIVPKTVIGDYGKSLEEFVLAAKQSYRGQYPYWGFTNHRKGELAKQITIVPGCRHEQLVAAIAESTVVGIYFPNPLQGFSVDAQRGQMATLPESFQLSGGIDTSMAWVMYPDVLARDANIPYYDCSALQGLSFAYSLYFGADDALAYFDSRGNLDDACDIYSGGLLFVG
ncbi:MAG: hypothetical protein AAB871_00690 [Patescibacteria group bacterium]